MACVRLGEAVSSVRVRPGPGPTGRRMARLGSVPVVTIAAGSDLFHSLLPLRQFRMRACIKSTGNFGTPAGVQCVPFRLVTAPFRHPSDSPDLPAPARSSGQTQSEDPRRWYSQAAHAGHDRYNLFSQPPQGGRPSTSAYQFTIPPFTIPSSSRPAKGD